MPLTVLVVDDDPGICHNLATYLADEGLHVHTAKTGEDALRFIKAGLVVQVCIMDLRLSNMSGISAIAAIRDFAPNMRFIIHTGSDDETVEAALQQAELSHLPVFRKPLLDMGKLENFLRENAA